jgi:lipopolysaccharide export system protein LptA
VSNLRFSRRLRAAAFAAVVALVVLPASHAERADRFKPLNVEADLPGKIDLLRQFVVFNGNVVVTKGTMTIRGRVRLAGEACDVPPEARRPR